MHHQFFIQIHSRLVHSLNFNNRICIESFIFSVGYKCPATYNPADFYVQTLAIVPGLEDSSRTTVRAICDRFTVTPTAKQIDLLIQYETSLGQEMFELSSRSGSSVSYLGLYVPFFLFSIPHPFKKLFL